MRKKFHEGGNKVAFNFLFSFTRQKERIGEVGKFRDILFWSISCDRAILVKVTKSFFIGLLIAKLVVNCDKIKVMEQFLSQNIYWTEHVKAKMRQYRLSESRVKRVLRHPKRLEIGVAPDTVAGMQPAGSKKHPYEIWVMWFLDKARGKQFKIQKSKCKVTMQNAKFTRFKNRETVIISAWKYPGVSPVHEPPPIPDDVWEIIRRNKK